MTTRPVTTPDKHIVFTMEMDIFIGLGIDRQGLQLSGLMISVFFRGLLVGVNVLVLLRASSCVKKEQKDKV